MNPGYQMRLGSKAGDYYNQGYHCSEAVLLALSEHLFGEVDPTSLRIATAMADGIGHSHEEACGAFTAGVLILGMLFGREHPAQSDLRCQQLTHAWREHFLTSFGHTQCEALRTRSFEEHEQVQCASIVAQSVPILLQIIAEAKGS